MEKSLSAFDWRPGFRPSACRVGELGNRLFSRDSKLFQTDALSLWKPAILKKCWQEGRGELAISRFRGAQI